MGHFSLSTVICLYNLWQIYLKFFANQHCLKWLSKYIIFPHWKKYQKHCIPLKTNFETPFFLLKDVREQAAVFDYYKYGLHISNRINRWVFQKKLWCGHSCCLLSCFNFKWLFSNYVLKILATVLVSSKPSQNCEWCARSRVSFLISVAMFFNYLIARVYIQSKYQITSLFLNAFLYCS